MRKEPPPAGSFVCGSPLEEAGNGLGRQRARPASFADVQRGRLLYRHSSRDGSPEQARVQLSYTSAVTGRALRKDHDGTAPAQTPAHDPRRISGLTDITLQEDGPRRLCHPADQRPAANFGLGKETPLGYGA